MCEIIQEKKTEKTNEGIVRYMGKGAEQAITSSSCDPKESRPRPWKDDDASWSIHPPSCHHPPEASQCPPSSSPDTGVDMGGTVGCAAAAVVGGRPWIDQSPCEAWSRSSCPCGS